MNYEKCLEIYLFSEASNISFYNNLLISVIVYTLRRIISNSECLEYKFVFYSFKYIIFALYQVYNFSANIGAVHSMFTVCTHQVLYLALDRLIRATNVDKYMYDGMDRMYPVHTVGILECTRR